MTATYRVELVFADRNDWAAELSDAIVAEVQALGLHTSVDVQVDVSPPAGEPAVTVYLGSPAAAIDPACIDAVNAAVADARSILPIVSDLDTYIAETPTALHPINGWEWSGGEPAKRLARFIFEELGIEERQRSVFISHRRADGLYAAEQLRDYLSHYRFDCFIDRFDVATGEDVQRRIADALEERAFLLLLETPLAHESTWVFDEVDYALTHTMGVHIVRWPDTTQDVPGSDRLTRQLLGGADLTTHKGYSALVEDALEAVLCEVEAAHAAALVRRRRQLLRNVEDAAEVRGLNCVPLPGWRLLVQGHGVADVVGVSGRLPNVLDLYELDRAREAVSTSGTGGVLVHSARMLDQARRDLLAWAAGVRSMTLVPDNAIGGYW